MDLIQSFKGVGFFRFKACHKGTCINFVNVYAPCNPVLRREVLSSLIKLKSLAMGEECCVGGDLKFRYV